MSVITIGNFKGELGKTTVSTLLLYIAKGLLVDFDPQCNATQIMKRTYPAPIKCTQRNTFTFLKVFKKSFRF